MLTLEEGRSRVQQMGHWALDTELSKTGLVLIPEVEGTRIGLRRGDMVLPVTDTIGLLAQAGISSGGLREFESDPELVARMISHSIAKRKDVLARFTGTVSRVSSVTTPKGGCVVPPATVFDVIAEEIPVKNVQIEEHGHTLRMWFVSQQATDRPKEKGDLIHTGIVVRMNGQVELGPYCWRLACTNGVQRCYERLRKVNHTDLVAQEVRNVCQAQKVRATTLVGHLFALDDVRVENNEQTIIRLGQEFALPRPFVQGVVEMLPELPNSPSMYDVMNLATMSARDLPTASRERVTTLLGEATTVMATNAHRCSHCSSRLRRS
jgi:hypothetical protein